MQRAATGSLGSFRMCLFLPVYTLAQAAFWDNAMSNHFLDFSPAHNVIKNADDTALVPIGRGAPSTELPKKCNLQETKFSCLEEPLAMALS